MLELLFIIAISLIAGIMWVWFFYSQDVFEKEPKLLLAKTFISGAIAVIPAFIFEYKFRNLLNSEATLLTRIWVAFVIVGLGEELFKFGALYFSAYRTREMNEVMDGIVYGVTAALGFSVVENVLYAVTYGIEVGLIRLIIASLAHASFTGLMGFFVGQGRVLTGIVVASFLHGLYDFILLEELFSPFIAIVLVFVLYGILRYVISLALKESPFRSN